MYKIIEMMKKKDRNPPPASEIRMLGQGGFGCVYYRGFSPYGTVLSGDYVTKLTRREKSRELRIGKVVSKLPRYGEFFAVVLKLENVDLANVDDAEHVLAECDIVNKAASPGDKFQLLTQLYVPNITFVELAVQSNYYSRFSGFLNALISCRGHLLLGIARLQSEARIVHFDIKAENVVFNTLAKNPIIIDFGLSFVMDDVFRALNRQHADDYDRVVALRQFFYGFYPDYSAWPVEVHVVCYIVAETVKLNERAFDERDSAARARTVAVLSAEALQSLISAYISSSGSVMKRWPDAYKTAFYERTLARHTQTAVGRPGLDVIRDYLKDWKRWDVYSASVLFLDVLEIARRHRPESFPTAYATQTEAFSELLQRDAGFIQ